LLDISLLNLGKKYGKEWIFRNLDYSVPAASRTVILGGNGSGKSTLLQIISGYITPNEGSVSYKSGNGNIDLEQISKQLSLAAPYLQLIEEFTLAEMVRHAGQMKPFRKGLEEKEIIQLSGLAHAKNKYIKQFSSGMKQRLRLALAILSDTSLLLLDEPVSNLDREGISWYHQMIDNYSAGRTVIVCSNAITEEHYFCDREINLGELNNLKVKIA